MSEPRLRLRRLVIHKFGDVLGPTELDFAEGMNVLIGQNGGGKSTLLRLIVAAIEADAEIFRKYGVDLEAEWVMEQARVNYRLVVEREPVARPTGAGRGVRHFRPLVRAGEPGWSIQGTVEAQGRSWSWSWGSSAPRVVDGQFQEAATAEPPPWPIWWDSEVDGSNPTILAAGSGLCRLDEADRGFDELVGEPSADDVHLSSSLSDQGPRAWPLPFVAGTALDDSRWTATEAPWLRRLADLLRANDIVVEPGEVTRANGVARTFSASIRIKWPDGSYGPARDELSFGQRRLLALFWQLHATPELPLISDELTNGFHHGWVRPVLDEIGDRQSIVAAQNPLLLDELSFDSADDVRRAITLCRIRTLHDGRRQWVWGKPSMEQAERLFEAWKRGMSYVSELLKREGLW